jgi:hypothetical protein
LAGGAADTLELELDYKPRPLQALEHTAREGVRFSVLVCHRRFGKTSFALPELMRSLFESTHPRPRVAYVAPLLNQAKRIAWDGAKALTLPLQPFGRVVKEAELSIEFPAINGRLGLYGGDHPNSMRGEGFDDVVFDETALIDPTAWTQVIRPTLSDRGGRALFIGSAYGGLNLFHDLWDQAGADELGEWRRVMYKATQTGLIPAEELESLRRTMNAEEFAQEYLCSWAGALPGAYYAKELEAAELEGRIRQVDVDHETGCFTCWDLGISDAMACWVGQECGREIHWLRYIEWIGAGFPTCIADLHAEAIANRWVFTRHYAPHDIEVRELGTEVSRRTTAARLGLRMEKGPAGVPIPEGIDGVRRILKRSWFDAKGCADGLVRLRSYRGEYDPLKRVLSKIPVHDWASHCADAMRTYAMGRTGGVRSDWEAPLVISRG